MNRLDPNLANLTLVAERLGDMVGEVVFLGGCAVGLLLTDPAAPPVRATVDVDVIAELASTGAYHRFGERLRALGFREDSSDTVICRWVVGAVKVDVMPIDSDILGFANRWYPLALSTATETQLPSGITIRMVTAPCFIATKIEAFLGRGNGDWWGSHDLEDLIAVLDGRPEVEEELRRADLELHRFVAKTFTRWLQEPDFIEALSGHLPGDIASQGRKQGLLGRMERMATLG
ncbi:MAG: hypothetical protein COX57_04075 [Alphaproteobacteria bacterium CG_4_10_14_0_2_um_filter_63_37]|nr:MAG: hypothetical protein AUJ55_01400 [Proteobacteria bacterium CG1_02_64_396]PJA25299.1 MAG: hypothetical protein COX57_04075 [Alphaproteobacteria bacterium CG_4_10_14_0_2_um_filter_63_37]